MVRVLGLPEGKRAHRFIPMDKEDFYYPDGRSNRYTVLEINMMEGRTKETIKKLIHTLFQLFEKELGILPVDLEITVKTQPAYCWGFRGICGDDAVLNYQVQR